MGAQFGMGACSTKAKSMRHATKLEAPERPSTLLPWWWWRTTLLYATFSLTLVGLV